MLQSIFTGQSSTHDMFQDHVDGTIMLVIVLDQTSLRKILKFLALFKKKRKKKKKNERTN